MKRAIFIAHRFPFPPNKGDKLRAYNILKYLTRRYEVSLICHLDEERDLNELNRLDLPLKNVFFDFKPKKWRKLASFKALPKGSLSVVYFYAKELQVRFNQLVKKDPISLIFCSCAPAAEYVFRGPETKARLFLDFMDVDSEKWRLYAERSGFPWRLVYALEAGRMRTYEKKIVKAFDRVFLVSAAEAALFQEKVESSPKVTVLENGVDLDFFSPAYRSKLKKNGPTVVFTGAMDYWPNAEGVIWFAREIWPLVKNEFPKATFYVVGKDPLPEVEALSKEPGVQVTGFVPDARDYISLADVCVAPLRLARGIQNKVLEAMAMAKPVVATPEAAEGITFQESELLVAHQAKDFAEAVKELLKNPVKAHKIGRLARKRMEKDYSWEKKLEVLDAYLP
ncbi:sugar transferase, PEP-CTERM/EpsH1 system associated [Thermodesulfatator indicus DSM 15286]|uniref:Sugar transferase, PEP-CTERM/EpsH1 system associated n=1 Tax=Thermodesulfatator indicus (strain DSM 15286 / JCM 11887 / CIR29812) TaxID=667014 RepID=F8AC32_THEID|nr:TIGR03087 family PEP-CTERM/XrtA system glycosyltransferase [Thermodesulfatator indicus]AEH44587.1 sugar transferase, PEP-CTERM/EpsH1 system associated [Thermodesulfatator indicus DSM 15286]